MPRTADDGDEGPAEGVGTGGGSNDWARAISDAARSASIPPTSKLKSRRGTKSFSSVIRGIASYIAPGSAGGSVTMQTDVVLRSATPRRSRGLQNVRSDGDRAQRGSSAQNLDQSGGILGS